MTGEIPVPEPEDEMNERVEKLRLACIANARAILDITSDVDDVRNDWAAKGVETCIAVEMLPSHEDVIEFIGSIGLALGNITESIRGMKERARAATADITDLVGLAAADSSDTFAARAYVAVLEEQRVDAESQLDDMFRRYALMLAADVNLAANKAEES